MSIQIIIRQEIRSEKRREHSQERSLMGFTLVEVMAAILIIGIGITPLIIAQGKTLEKAGRSLILQQALLAAESAANEILFRGYTYYQSGTYAQTDEKFRVDADLTAEKISVPAIFQVEENTEENTEANQKEQLPADSEDTEEDQIVVYHITVTVTAVDNEDVKVTLKMDMPAETTDIKDIENLMLPEGTQNEPGQ